jgi:DNA-binding transcriptional ArsR family regulator
MSSPCSETPSVCASSNCWRAANCRSGAWSKSSAGNSTSAQPAVSNQLRILRDEGFVAVRTDGLSRRYRLAWDALERLDQAVESVFVLADAREGWPYEDRLLAELRASAAGEDLAAPPPRRHRAGRAGLRGRTRAEIEPRAADEEWWFGD